MVLTTEAQQSEINIVSLKTSIGYKITEFGFIPEDWNQATLGDKTIKIGSGITPTGGERIYKQSGRPFLRSQNIGKGHLLIDAIAYIDEETHETFKSTEVKVKDVLLNITGASIGRCAVADERVQGGNVNQHVCIIRTNKNELDSDFLNYFLLSSAGQSQIDSFQAGGNREGLNFGQIRSFTLPCPSLKEQITIAATLKDMDSLINCLDQLISKKRNIKLAATQQLLTGKQRLPGFKDEWQVVNMSDNFSLKARIGWQGLTTAEYLEAGDYLLVTGTDIANGRINWADCFCVDFCRYNQDKNIQLQVGDVLLSKDGTIGKVAYIDYLPRPATLNSGVFVIRPKNKKVDSLYLFYILKSNIFIDYLNKLQAGSTISHLYQKDFVGFKFLSPSIKEQMSIATILTEMDTELSTLEQQLSKARNLKQGMMQELLTGRIRLI
ncbi:MAG: restriction endonuclease subunit S [Proteobacteria bacterium]|nr:restriction endonuclease subunit S [Pseudomonadota bacterium]